jgi:hypothetical protein
MKKVLEEKDKQNIFGFIKRFRSHSDEIKDLEEKLKNLIKEKNEALARLNKTRSDEKIYTQTLHEKYGKGHFDLTDLNYWILD